MSHATKLWRNGIGIGVAVTPTQAQAFAAAGFELFEGRVQLDGRETAYLCDNFVCQLPIMDAAALDELLYN
jgi:hypothetical protein